MTEKQLNKAIPTQTGTLVDKGYGRYSAREKINFIRYVDDFIVTASNEDILHNKIIPTITDFLALRGLRLSEQKTSITHINQGIDFLGKNIRKYGQVLLIKPSKKSIQQLKDKIKTVFQSMRGAPAWALIRKLNPILKGWANYHKHHVSKLTFQRIKQYLFHKIRAWLIRNHPHKSWYWRKRRYFRKLKGVQHFSDVAKDDKRIFLFQIDKMPIKRHRKIKMAANPFDPEWEMYFEQRLDEKMEEKLRNKLAQLYRRQKGKCTHCE